MDMIFRNRKFGLAVAALVCANVWLGMDKLSGNEFFLLVSAILTQYSWANVKDKQ